jgi:hypothetical protein
MSNPDVKYREAMERMSASLVRLLEWEAELMWTGGTFEEAVEGQVVALLSRIAELLGFSCRMRYSTPNYMNLPTEEKEAPLQWIGRLQRCILGFPFKNPFHRVAAQEELRQIVYYASSSGSLRPYANIRNKNRNLPRPFLNRELLPKWNDNSWPSVKGL